ncbi:MAG TPA: hypothetical protein PKA61_12470 [Nitrospira sp.]|nr:hypothetical protein [Nitrospira sp.]
MIVPYLLLLLVLGPWWADPVQAQPELHTIITESLDECHLGRVAQERAMRLAHFEKGQRLGEQAVSFDDRSPDAHFALFCNLGELMRLDGEMSLGSVLGFRRMMKELDRTLELAPDHLDALSARGTFLVRLPAMLGGNPDTGEQLLRRVIASEPKAVNARLSLAKSYCARGRHDEAVVLASEALALAEAQHRDDFIPEAKRVMAQLHTTANAGR